MTLTLTPCGVRRALAVLALSIPFLTASAAPRGRPTIPTFSDVTVHDPSIVSAGSEFFVFGSHLASARSTDLRHWTQVSSDPVAGNPLAPDPQAEFAEALAWTGEGSAFWAPDAIQLADGRYYYYYCTGRLDAPRAALGVAVSDSITGPYKNLGVFLKSGMWGQPSPDGTIYDPARHPNTVDPDVFFDQTGKLWMVYGSYSGGIFILRLDPTSGFPLPGQGYGKKLIGANHSAIEGPFILYSPESDYYYLFLSFGGLDVNGGYNIRMGRSRTPDGPYLDAAGTDLTTVGGPPGTFFDDSAIIPHGVKLMGGYRFAAVAGEPATHPRGYRSPGHNSAYYDPTTGKHFLVFHVRYEGQGEVHNVRVHQLVMNADEWLVAAPHRYAGEDLPRMRNPDVPGVYKLLNHEKENNRTTINSAPITLHPNRKITGAATGTWQLSHDYDLTLTLDGTSYRGVLLNQWDDENAAWVTAFSALSADGVSVWGSEAVLAKKTRTKPLADHVVLNGDTLDVALPKARGKAGEVITYRLAQGPAGMTVDRETGRVAWKPTLADVGLTFPVTVLAHETTEGFERVLHTFNVVVSSPFVVRRTDLSFSAAGGGGVADANGRFTGFTTRLPGTGGALGANDPHLLLEPAAGLLKLNTTQADFPGRVGLANTSAPGIALADLGFTGTEDFAVTVVFRALPGIEFIDQAGLYVGPASDAFTRAGTIVFGSPEYHSTHSENGVDRDGRFYGFGLDVSQGMTVTITREAGVWRYVVNGVTWNPHTPPDFLDGRGDLIAGVFALTPLNNNVKAIEVDSFSVVVATHQLQTPAAP